MTNHAPGGRVKTAAAILTAAMCLQLGGCSIGAPAMGEPIRPGTGEALTVWVMQGDFSDGTLEAINREFTERTGVPVDVQVQQWDRISTKITTALVTPDPPDVLDIGNTKVSGFAANGGLADLDAYRFRFEHEASWLSGLEDPATLDGSLYGIPVFGATRAVIYNKKMWAQAGIDTPPSTWDELIADLDAVAERFADDPGFCPLYLPGRNWFSGVQFIWDAGGELARNDGGWGGLVSSPASLTGLERWRDFQNRYSTPASRTAETASPDMSQLLAEGRTSAILWNSASMRNVTVINPDITADDLGSFAMPGYNGGMQPAVLAGSVLSVASRSPNTDLAVEWIGIATGERIQHDYVVGKDGWLPNNLDQLDSILSEQGFAQSQRGFFEAARNSRATPVSPNWSRVEEDGSLPSLFVSVATGSSTPRAAAQRFDAHLDDVL